MGRKSRDTQAEVTESSFGGGAAVLPAAAVAALTVAALAYQLPVGRQLEATLLVTSRGSSCLRCQLSGTLGRRCSSSM